MKMSYWRFAAMIVTSTVVMFALMYVHTHTWHDAYFSETRAWMAVLMGATMTIVMLGFMWPMYEGQKAKVATVVLAAIAGVALLSTNRNQALVSDVLFMKAMIPHHSIAINNARKADISDPRVRKLADGIIESQVREIEEMKLLIDDIGSNGERGKEPLPARSAMVTPDMLPKIREAVQ